MKQARSFVSFIVSYTLIFSFLSFAIPSVSAQDSKIALQRGFRTGYSDGYMSGYRDTIDNATKSYQRHKEYKDADRAFNKDYGMLEDYTDGYRQGFEAGYDTGFSKMSFDAAIPANLSRRAPVLLDSNVAETTQKNPIPIETKTNRVEENVTYSNPSSDTETNGNISDSTTPINTQKVSYNPNINDAIIVIPADTELIVELLDSIDSEKSSEGDAFKARIVSPFEISGAIVEGRVSKIQKPGRIKRRAEVLLTFDRIVINDDRWSNYAAILTEVLPIKGDNVRRVDAEGTVEGKSSVKDDTIKVGALTGTGLVIGAVTGGPVGAAVGASVGAAFGVGAVVIERGKHIHLNKEQQLKIKTAYNTQIR
ncbi:MAG: hypothetical protein ABIP06_06890 [Pyrinomonadaceae bacterium]